MSHVVNAGDRLVLEFSPGRMSIWKGLDLQLLPPLLLGVMLPLLAISYFAPDAFRGLTIPIFLFLVLMFAVCAGLFFYAAHFPGSVQSITVLRNQRSIEITWQNLVATTSQVVPFDEIVALRCRTAYDHDGYPQTIPELVIRAQPSLELPPNTTEDELRPLRAAIGLG